MIQGARQPQGADQAPAASAGPSVNTQVPRHDAKVCPSISLVVVLPTRLLREITAIRRDPLIGVASGGQFAFGQFD